MDKTQYETYKAVQGIYREITALTEQIHSVDSEEQLQLLAYRQKCIDEAETKLSTVDSLPKGAENELLLKEKQILHDLLLSITVHDTLTSEKLTESMNTIESQIGESALKIRVAETYLLHSRKER